MIILAVLFSCSQEPSDYVLLDYYELFKSEAEARGVKIPSFDLVMVFVDYEPKGYSGYCDCTNETKLIRINKDSFDYAVSRELDEVFIFHELGHCVLNKEHGTGIMSKNILRDYEERRKEYLDELFKL